MVRVVVVVVVVVLVVVVVVAAAVAVVALGGVPAFTDTHECYGSLSSEVE